MMEQTVKDFVKEQARFDLEDPFRASKVRRLAYDYKMMEMKFQEEISYLKAIREEQSKVISLILSRLNIPGSNTLTTQKELDLEKELQKKSELMNALQAYAENLEKDLDKQKKSNMELQFQIKSAHALIAAMKPISQPVEEEPKDGLD